MQESVNSDLDRVIEDLLELRNQQRRAIVRHFREAPRRSRNIEAGARRAEVRRKKNKVSKDSRRRNR